MCHPPIPLSLLGEPPDARKGVFAAIGSPELPCGATPRQKYPERLSCERQSAPREVREGKNLPERARQRCPTESRPTQPRSRLADAFRPRITRVRIFALTSALGEDPEGEARRPRAREDKGRGGRSRPR